MAEIKTSWVILTYNRREAVERSAVRNLGNAGRRWHELIWCDNGSSDDVRAFMENLSPDVSILSRKNEGIPIGYNRALALCSGTHVVITGCDVLMPPNWLQKMAAVFERVPDTGIVCMYSDTLENLPERIRDKPKNINGILVQEAMPIGRRMLPVSLLHEIGYFHHGFSPYGWCDVEWAERAERLLRAKGLKSYVLPDQMCAHLITDGPVGRDYADGKAYQEWKNDQAHDPKKIELLKRLRNENYPKFNPFCSCGDRDAAI